MIHQDLRDIDRMRGIAEPSNSYTFGFLGDYRYSKRL